MMPENTLPIPGQEDASPEGIAPAHGRPALGLALEIAADWKSRRRTPVPGAMACMAGAGLFSARMDNDKA